MTTYKLKNRTYGDEVVWTVPEILKEVNRDRSEGWENYDETDWQEGLEDFTDYYIIT